MGFAGRATRGGDALPFNAVSPVPTGSCPQSQHKPLCTTQVFRYQVITLLAHGQQPGEVSEGRSTTWFNCFPKDRSQSSSAKKTRPDQVFGTASRPGPPLRWIRAMRGQLDPPQELLAPCIPQADALTGTRIENPRVTKRQWSRKPNNSTTTKKLVSVAVSEPHQTRKQKAKRNMFTASARRGLRFWCLKYCWLKYCRSQSVHRSSLISAHIFSGCKLP